MMIDKDAAPIEAAAKAYADDWRHGCGRVLMNRDAVAVLLEAAFVAGACAVRKYYAKADTVQATPELLAAARTVRL